MKTLFGMVSLLLILFGLAFHFDGSVRETTYYLAASQPQKELIDVYREGRDIFFSKWTGKATEMAYWGDDPYVSARKVQGDYWLASGRVSFVLLGTPVRQPWLCLFRKSTREMVLYNVGGETDETLSEIKRGELDVLLAKHGNADVADSPARTPTPSPLHGIQGTALDQKAHR